ncbi:hypothetical protein G9A89_006008 [Geosiphon pyriformis]|nr:hypothetical protein G9A89_006008 [Geosiphon pyriformis]
MFNFITLIFSFGPSFVLVTILAFTFYYLRKPKYNLNEPPLVPYKYPFIGHTYEIRNDCEGFLRRCREKYGDIYRIYQYGQVYSIAGNDSAQEFMINKDASNIKAIETAFPLMGLLGLDHPTQRALVPLTRDRITPLIPNLNEGIQYRAKISVEKHFGISKEPKTIYSLVETIQDINAFATSFVFIGEELSRDQELITSCARFSNDIFDFLKYPRTLAFIHPWLYKQHLLLAGEKEKIDYNRMARFIYTLIFVSVYPTSLKIADAILDYAAETEYQKELVEEQEEIAKEYGPDGFPTIAQLEKMVKLDSFVKESIRYNEDFLNVPKLNTSSSPITLSNGYQIPPNGKVICDFISVIESEELHGSHPNKFDPRRYLNKNEPITRLSRGFLSFGLGRYACPGRFFAMNLAKILLSMIIRNYKVSLKVGTRPKKIIFEEHRLLQTMV